MKRILSLSLVLNFITVFVFGQLHDTGGNVGIGTNTPGAKLEVVGDVFARGTLTSVIPGEIGGRVQIRNTAKTGSGEASIWTIYNMTGSYSNSLQFWAYDNLSCGVPGGLCNQRVVFMDNGNVGIGVNDPQAKLAVGGGIVATKIKVSATLAWPDYVFETSYALPSLKEVEKHILQYKHLPDVPSAKEVEDNGLDLGDNQAVLLKKIEELTLYMIAQDKKIEVMQEEIKQLKTQK